MHADADSDDDSDSEYCYRHPGRETALRCVTCDRPICIDCAIAAPVGFKCPDHGRTSRAERAVVPAARLARGAAAGIAVALVVGTLLSRAGIPYIGIILAYFAGALVGDVTRRASGGYRDPLLARIATIAAATGFLARPAYLLLLGATASQWLVWAIVEAAAAAYGAYTRAS